MQFEGASISRGFACTLECSALYLYPPQSARALPAASYRSIEREVVLHNRFSRILTLSAASLLLVLGGCRHKTSNAPATDHATSDPMEQALHTDADAGHLASLHWPDFSDYKPLVETFYSERGWDPAWVDDHKPTKQALALLKLFAMSGSKGLNPDDYDASLWQSRLSRLGAANDAQIAEFDTAMTVSAMRYISDLHIGRVNPEHFDFGVSVQTKKYDLANFMVQQVVAAGDMDEALKGVEPESVEYRETEKALVHYQALASQAGTEQLLPSPAKALSPGAPYSGASALAARLALLGDIDGSTSGNENASRIYTPAIADGVQKFQSRHDLPSDGRLTPQTVTALNVPLATRVHQLEDTLERMRWLAPEYQTAPIEVNVPEFTLRAYGDDHKQEFEMRVVVGQALEEDHKTPVLVQEMKYLVLRPFWNVTPTIVTKEIVPHVEADKGYLEAKNFEVVDRTGKPVQNWTAEALSKNLYMVREKPGPKNSLGLIKFMFPNKLNIYLHSTPATELFNRSRRDFSHGCVRLQDPEKLADWVLRDQSEWTPDKIHDAMENGQDNKTVLLKHPIPVLISYQTARVGEDGRVYFFKDLYGYDKDMEDVLSKGDPFPVKPEPKKQTGDTA
jgi:murein L,D-transpeptidase YcbB/YkuD